MRIPLLSLVVICAFIAPAVSQTKNQANDLKSMVETERAFARMSEEKGTREAFAEFIAADGILFRPGPVVGKKWMQEHPLPTATTRPLLSWQPIFAAVSRAGDLGYTTGPWQFKQDIKDAKPAAFGNFMTVWKKQADGSWKFVLDLGISNPEPPAPATSWQVPEGSQSTSGKAKTVNQEAERSILLRVDREFSNTSALRGAAAAFRSYAASDVRLYRNDKFPFVGKLAAADALVPLQAEWTWTPSFADVSISGDLGYTYGVYEVREKNGARAVSEKGNYARVWKKEGSTWKLVIDVANPLPPESKQN
jgi:ketosteroid isomerase-like protein